MEDVVGPGESSESLVVSRRTQEEGVPDGAPVRGEQVAPANRPQGTGVAPSIPCDFVLVSSNAGHRGSPHLSALCRASPVIGTKIA
jgi:hypothetical protein